MYNRMYTHEISSVFKDVSVCVCVHVCYEASTEVKSQLCGVSSHVRSGSQTHVCQALCQTCLPVHKQRIFLKDPVTCMITFKTGERPLQHPDPVNLARVCSYSSTTIWTATDRSSLLLNPGLLSSPLSVPSA